MADSKSPATKADIENLVSLFTESHQATQRQFGQLQASHGQLHERIDELEGKLTHWVSELKMYIDTQTAEIERRMTNLLQSYVAEIRGIDSVEMDLKDIDRRVRVLESRAGIAV